MRRLAGRKILIVFSSASVASLITALGFFKFPFMIPDYRRNIAFHAAAHLRAVALAQSSQPDRAVHQLEELLCMDMARLAAARKFALRPGRRHLSGTRRNIDYLLHEIATYAEGHVTQFADRGQTPNPTQSPEIARDNRNRRELSKRVSSLINEVLKKGPPPETEAARKLEPE